MLFIKITLALAPKTINALHPFTAPPPHVRLIKYTVAPVVILSKDLNFRSMVCRDTTNGSESILSVKFTFPINVTGLESATMICVVCMIEMHNCVQLSHH